MDNENTNVEETEDYDFNDNPVLKETVAIDTPFKEMVVNYVGEQFSPEDNCSNIL